MNPTLVVYVSPLGEPLVRQAKSWTPVVVHHWIGPHQSAVMYHHHPLIPSMPPDRRGSPPPRSRRTRPARLAVGTVATTATWFRLGHVLNPKTCHDSKLENHVSHVGIALREEVDDRPGFFDS